MRPTLAISRCAFTRTHPSTNLPSASHDFVNVEQDPVKFNSLVVRFVGGTPTETVENGQEALSVRALWKPAEGEL